MARQSRPAQGHGTNHAVANGRHARQHAMRGTAVAQTSKENVPHVHADGAVCDAIRRSNCECCKVGILIMAMLVTAPWRRSTAQQRARAAPRWLPKESSMPCRVSRAPDRARHTPRVPCPACKPTKNSPQPHTSAVGAACAAAACVQAIIHCTPLASGGRPSGSNQRRSFGERR